MVSAIWRASLPLLTLSLVVEAQSYRAPAGVRPAFRTQHASVLPGGRIVAPLGDQYATGSGAFGMAVNSSGRTVVTSNGGPGRNSLTVLDRDRGGRWEIRQLVAPTRAPSGETSDADWRSAFMGLAFSGEHAIFASEGNTGRISLFDMSGERKRVIELDQGDYRDSYAGDLAFDAERGILYAVDQANFRVVAIDVHTRRVVASVRVGRLPFALALSPDRQKLYVTNVGMFEYRAIPGADARNAGATGLSFPAFGFPSAEAANGVERRTAGGPVKVPPLGDPNARESNSVCVVDVTNPAALKVQAFIRTGLPLGDKTYGGSSPSGIVATADRVFVSNTNDDSVTVIDARTNRAEAEIPIRIPGLEQLRGLLPVGLAYHAHSGWLLVAEAGINAVAVIDPARKRVLGHIPAGWFPTCVAVDRDSVFVANARGRGTGPNAFAAEPGELLPSQFRQGSLSVFPLPAEGELDAQTSFVMRANGFTPVSTASQPLPVGIRHVVLIVKESRTYDEVLGDIQQASNGPVMGAPELARFGTRGYVDGRGKRFSLKDVNITPNHHAIAHRWAFSDNFYADSDGRVDGHHWLVGAAPNAWTESSLLAACSDQKKDFRLGTAPGRLLFAGPHASVQPEDQPEGGTIWHHLERHGVSFYNFGEGLELAGVDEGPGLEPGGARFLTNIPMPDPLYRNTSREYPGFNMKISDQYRASEFIREIETKYVRTGAELPRFLFVSLPGDHLAKPRPEDGYPYEESFVVDNDYALGRIVEYLSGTRWWREMAVFVTEADAQGGVDHIDGHRTMLLCAGPWAKTDYVSHTNTGFPGLLKTIFRLLGIPPLNLFDAAAADLSDCFSSQPRFDGFHSLDVDRRIFDPETRRESRRSEPALQTGDPREGRGARH